MKKYILALIILSFTSFGNLSSKNKVQDTDVKKDSINFKYNAIFQEGLKMQYLKKYAEAFDLFKYCTLIDSTQPSAWNQISSYYQNINDSVKALYCMEKAYELKKGDRWYTEDLGNLYIKNKQYSKAEKIYLELSKAVPNDESALWQLSNLQRIAKNYKSSINTLDKIENKIGKNENISMQKFSLYLAIKKKKKAIKEIKDLVKDNPYDVKRVLLLGKAYLTLSDKENAYQTFMKAKEMDGDNPYVSLSLSDYYLSQNDTVSYNKELKKVLINPETEYKDKMTIFYPILVKALKTKDTTNISGYFKTIIEQHPNEYSIRELHVKWLLNFGKKEEAKTELRNDLDLHPDQKEKWINYLELNLALKNNKEIIEICNEAIHYFPKEPRFWFYKGISWNSKDNSYGGKNPQNALKSFKQGLKVAKHKTPIASSLNSMIGNIYLNLKDTTTAFKYYEQSILENPKNILALNNYAYYLSESNKELAKAEKMSRLTVEAEPKNATYLDTFAWIFFKEEKYGLAKIYIERAIENYKGNDAVLYEHYGDILWHNDLKEEAIKQWIKSSEEGNKSKKLLQKINSKNYIK